MGRNKSFTKYAKMLKKYSKKIASSKIESTFVEHNHLIVENNVSN
jgi:hypothetical protein